MKSQNWLKSLPMRASGQSTGFCGEELKIWVNCKWSENISVSRPWQSIGMRVVEEINSNHQEYSGNVDVEW